MAASMADTSPKQKIRNIITTLSINLGDILFASNIGFGMRVTW